MARGQSSGGTLGCSVGCSAASGRYLRMMGSRLVLFRCWKVASGCPLFLTWVNRFVLWMFLWGPRSVRPVSVFVPPSYSSDVMRSIKSLVWAFACVFAFSVASWFGAAAAAASRSANLAVTAAWCGLVVVHQELLLPHEPPLQSRSSCCRPGPTLLYLWLHAPPWSLSPAFSRCVIFSWSKTLTRFVYLFWCRIHPVHVRPSSPVFFPPLPRAVRVSSRAADAWWGVWVIVWFTISTSISLA